MGSGGEGVIHIEVWDFDIIVVVECPVYRIVHLCIEALEKALYTQIRWKNELKKRKFVYKDID